MDYTAAIVVVWQLPAKVLYWTDSKTFRKYESFTQPNM